MKNLILILLVLSILFVIAEEKVVFIESKSFLIDGKNITLVKANKDGAVFCVNGVKGIVSEGKSNIINGVWIETEDFNPIIKTLETDITYKCKKCLCDTSCNNNACLKSSIKQIISNVNDKETDNEIIIKEDENLQEITGEVIVSSPSISKAGIVTSILVVVILILGLIVLWKKY